MKTRTRRTLATGSLLALILAAGAIGSSPIFALTPAILQAQPQGGAGTPELLLDQGKRLFDAFQYEQAIPLLDRAIAALTITGQPPRAELLIQAYELRGRARFALGDTLGTEQDFSALLALKPGFELPGGVSPRVVDVLNAVRKVTVGQVALSMTPAGDAEIDGHTYALRPDPQTIDLSAGDHQVRATRTGYRPVAETLTIAAGNLSTLALTLERVSSTVSVRSIPDGVEILLDGTVRGRTAGGSATAPSAPMVLADLAPGTHRLLLRRDCHQQVERTITIDQPGDITIDPIKLTPTVASVRLTGAEPGSTLFVDGVSRGPVPAVATDICEGAHVVEVRGAKGRFMDRRDWKTGETATVAVEMRAAFPIVAARSGGTVSAEQLRVNVERALAPAKRVLVYVPVDSDLKAALSGETVPADWLVPDAPTGAAPAPSAPREVTRDLGRKLASRLGAQGVAVVASGADPYVVTLALLAPGSSEPDLLTINLADAPSRSRAFDAFGAPVPAFVRPSIETSFVDVAGISGAVVARPAGVGAKAGLATGDVVTAAGGTPIATAGDLRARIAAVKAPALDLALDVAGAGGAARKVTVSVVMVPDTIPLRDASLLYNVALIDLGDAVKGASSPAGVFAAHVNAAIVHMRLGDWDDALAELTQAQWADGPGVSAGTVAYLTGLCDEATGRPAEAQAAFTKAAASMQARLWQDGPLVAPLARQKLTRR